MRTSSTVENIVTMILIAVIVLGLYAMGAGLWSFVGFVLLVNINFPIHRGGAEKKSCG